MQQALPAPPRDVRWPLTDEYTGALLSMKGDATVKVHVGV
jgi:hypothetical protein